ncbi:NACHT, LRR and PYD domains-containing protein 5-like [Stylophora pistillata]|uniref:NACHT, LRR and PYD domains-containing protein 12 n=1 Tax=Stylophora pistillata TaxID=50429 RepID=A0A2B4R930_STYPI|nr:NACHT, LRR and PYD domains-containing protein 5-like [Stylophora pistillata]PFX13010.1 NACHT, LRR and PYD domains-containing protein 12 [Stylophora pistillata]
MASGAAPTFHSTKETTNYARLCRLLVDVGTHVLRETFEKTRPPGKLDTVLSSAPVHKALQLLKKRKVLNLSQWGKLYPAIKSSVSSQHFDITLLMVLLRNICGLVPPATGWNTLPPVADTTLEADIIRIMCCRNTVYGHATKASVDDATFSQYWMDIQVALMRLGGARYQIVVDDLENESMDPEFEEHYKELLKQWVMDDVNIKEGLNEIKEIVRKLDERMESTSNPERKVGAEDVAAYTNALKESVKSQTEFHAVASPTSSKVRTDDIFTSILIQHGRKPVGDSDMERKKRLRQYGQVSEKPVKHCQEIFISDTNGSEERNPKSVLVTGKAGIGKTLFCQKLIRDWADNKLFLSRTKLHNPDFKFAYLLTFRQLNLLGDDCVTLREILNRSSALDNRSSIDNSLFEYIVDHPEEVLIIIDGYDEYAQQHFIANDLDDRYPNDAHEQMPVAALCAKLLKGKILRGLVVTITSRPDESDEIKDKISFDRCVEVTGFSEQQVKEYIGKHFRENEVIKNAVMDHITKNDNLVSFAHIPVLCFLMCSYFEYTLIESMNTDALPVNMSDIYFEVVTMFLRKHCKKGGTPPKVTLEKLSKLAADFLLVNKFLFAVEDMKDFTVEEVESLRASGLLHCGPIFRKTFSETTKYFCFTHLTLHEYLAAQWFVENKRIPSLRQTSEMVFTFMSGILSKQKDNDLMQQLIGRLDRQPLTSLLTLKCLAEYQDMKFAQEIVKTQYRIEEHHKDIRFEDEFDWIALSFLLDVISSLNDAKTARKNQTLLQQIRMPLVQRLSPFRCSCCRRNAEETADRSQPSPYHLPKRLTINWDLISPTGLKRIRKALENDLCPITELVVVGFAGLCNWDSTIGEMLPLSKLLELRLLGNGVTDASVVSLCQALQTVTCQVTTLHLSYSLITDAGVVTLCQALQTGTCQVTSLHLSENRITDAGVVSLCQALQTATCQVTTLDLSGNQITDAGVCNLCQALQTVTCQVTSLDLSANQITDAGVVSLCQVLESGTCQVTALGLSSNSITVVGEMRLCRALRTLNFPVKLLERHNYFITSEANVVIC